MHICLHETVGYPRTGAREPGRGILFPKTLTVFLQLFSAPEPQALCAGVTV